MLNFMINKVKTFILTKSPQSPNYLTYQYMILLSRISCISRIKHKNIRLKHISLLPNSQFNNIYKLENKQKKIILVQDFTRVNRFISGFDHAYSRIWDQYLLADFKFTRESPVVVDIGANIGEFVNAAALEKAFSIYAFEPDPISFFCLIHNTRTLLPKVKLFNTALSNANGRQKFYLSSSNADSSLIEPPTYTESLVIEATRFDAMPEMISLPIIDLLKMDAEGAEPEVLDGIGELVCKISNFAIDVGPERNGSSTVQAVSEYFKRKKIKYVVKQHSSGRLIIHAGKSIVDA